MAGKDDARDFPKEIQQALDADEDITELLEAAAEAGADLSNVHLSKEICKRIQEDLKSNKDIRKILEAAIKAKVILVEIKLSDANLNSANLSRTNLERADLSGAKLWRTDLSGANLLGANLSGAVLREANLSGANLLGANLSMTNLERADLSGAKLFHTDLSGANLNDANLSDADLDSANLSGAYLLDANLSGANLHGANLSGAKLWWANISGTDLSDAKLLSADLREAKLLSGTDGQPTNLLRADLQGARFMGIYIGADTILGDTTLFGCDVSGSNKYLVYDEKLVTQNGDVENRPDYNGCADIYRQLKRCYQDSGHYTIAGEFFINEMRCRRLQMGRDGGFWRWLTSGLWWLYEKIAGYGERPAKVAGWALGVILLCAILQECCCGIMDTNNSHLVIGPGLPSFDAGWFARTITGLYFSTITFTTTGYGDLGPSGPGGQILSGLEALAGSLLIALFLVCLVRKFNR